MSENTNVSKAVEEIKNADEEQLKKIIERWFEQTRTAGLKLGAQMISVVINDAIEKNLKNGYNSSLRDYQRAIKRIAEIISIQLTQQNDYEVEETLEEETNDGTAE